MCTLVMQLASGDLIAYLQRFSKKCVLEHHGKTLAQHLLLGVDHLHSKNIIHVRLFVKQLLWHSFSGMARLQGEVQMLQRDLKPGNTLLMYGEGGFLAVVSDYGCSKYITSYARTLRMGTPGYQAPERLRGGNYGKPVDIWAFGEIFMASRHVFISASVLKQQCDIVVCRYRSYHV